MTRVPAAAAKNTSTVVENDIIVMEDIDIKKAIEEIAQNLDAYHDYDSYLNLDTGEIEMLPSICNCDWSEEMLQEIEDIVESWEHVYKFEPLASFESFDIMERFVLYGVKEGSRLQQQLENAIRRKHPFRNFNALIHNCSAREDWFCFKQHALERHVMKLLLFESSVPESLREYCQKHLSKD